MKELYDYFCDRTLAYLALNAHPTLLKDAAWSQYGFRDGKLYAVGDRFLMTDPAAFTKLTDDLGLSPVEARRLEWSLKYDPSSLSQPFEGRHGPLHFIRQGDAVIPLWGNPDDSALDFATMTPVERGLHQRVSQLFDPQPQQPASQEAMWQAFLPGLVFGYGGVPFGYGGMPFGFGGMPFGMGIPGMFGMGWV